MHSGGGGVREEEGRPERRLLKACGGEVVAGAGMGAGGDKRLDLGCSLGRAASSLQHNQPPPLGSTSCTVPEGPGPVSQGTMRSLKAAFRTPPLQFLGRFFLLNYKTFQHTENNVTDTCAH